jgi:hypothetical protein
LLIFVGAASLQAQINPPYGLTLVQSGYADQTILPVSPVFSVTNFQAIAYQDSWVCPGELSYSEFSGSVQFSNGLIHAYSICDLLPGAQYGSGSSAVADLALYDTFYISGPAGQSGQFQITLTFNGGEPTSLPLDEIGPETIYGAAGGTFAAQVATNSAWITWGDAGSFPILTLNTPLTASTNSPALEPETSNAVLSLESGSSIVISELLAMRNVIEDAEFVTVPGGSVMEAGAASMTVTPLTSGFGFTTASGSSYSPPAAPLPVTASLSVGGASVFISFLTQANYIYLVSYKTNLTDAAWIPLSDGSLVGDGAIKTVSDGVFASQQFYHVVAY